MSFDIFGTAPRSEAGRRISFRATDWRPIQLYVAAEHPALFDRCELWGSNDGDGLGDEDAAALGRAITVALANGAVGAWAERYAAEVAARPHIECELCRGSGVRAAATRPLGAGISGREDVPSTGCNGCAGTGRRAPVESLYVFRPELLERFAAFLLDCGGFAIY